MDDQNFVRTIDIIDSDSDFLCRAVCRWIWMAAEESIPTTVTDTPLSILCGRVGNTSSSYNIISILDMNDSNGYPRSILQSRDLDGVVWDTHTQHIHSSMNDTATDTPWILPERDRVRMERESSHTNTPCSNRQY